jgi:hypothetical protein
MENTTFNPIDFSRDDITGNAANPTNGDGIPRHSYAYAMVCAAANEKVLNKYINFLVSVCTARSTIDPCEFEKFFREHVGAYRHNNPIPVGVFIINSESWLWGLSTVLRNKLGERADGLLFAAHQKIFDPDAWKDLTAVVAAVALRSGENFIISCSNKT